MIRKLLAALLALSVAFAPAAALAAGAPAASHNRSQLMEAGHCTAVPGGEQDKGSHDKSAKNCCIAMCMAVAVAPANAAGGGLPHRLTAMSRAPAFLTGHPAELATPPPRAA